MAFVKNSNFLEIYYNQRKIFWILLSISGTLITIFTSDEIVNYILNDDFILYDLPFILFFIVFIILNIYVRYFDLRQINYDPKKILFLSLFSLLMELLILLSFGFLGIYIMVYKIPNLINGLKGLLLISLPVSLGVTTVSSLTVEVLKQRVKNLRKEIEKNEEILNEYKEVRKKRDKEIDDLDNILDKLKLSDEENE